MIMKKIVKLLWLIINLCGSIALMISGYGGHINPNDWPIGGIALMIFPALLGGVLLLLVLNLLVWRRLAFLSALTILMCAPAIWNVCPMNVGTPSQPANSRLIKVMSYNVFNFDNYYSGRLDSSELNPTLSTIISSGADIVCLQESRQVGQTIGWAPQSQCDSVNMYYPYRVMSGSLAIWSKFPVDTVTMPASGEPTASYQCGRVNVNGTTLTVYNLHLQSIGLSPEDKTLYKDLTRKPTTHRIEDGRGLVSKLSHAMRQRANQAAQVRSAMDSIGGDNVIVAGDFNDIEGCYAQRLIENRRLHSLYTSVGLGPVVTYYANRFSFNIDHLLYGGNLKAMSYRRVAVKSSDHYAIEGVLAIKNSQD